MRAGYADSGSCRAIPPVVFSARDAEHARGRGHGIGAGSPAVAEFHADEFGSKEGCSTVS